jgi:predicted nucleic acid-binding protein
VLYLDTSLVVAAYTREAATERVQSWLATLQGNDTSISDWVVAEYSAALSIKVRTRQISDDYRERALRLFRWGMSESFKVRGLHSQHFRTAARFADRYKTGLRAGDALHLAIAADEGVTLCTLDRRQAEAGKVLGVITKLV